MANSPQASPTLLIVEDDADVRSAMVEVFEYEGCRVAAVCNGVEALAYLRAAPALPRLILLDLNMPVMDGATFREQQRKVPEWAAVPLVLMTADGRNTEAGPDAPLRPDGFIKKPVQLTTLLELTRRYALTG